MSRAAKALYALLRRYGSRIFWGAVNAARRGYRSFKAWYDGLPRLVRWALRAIGDPYTLYRLVWEIIRYIL